MQNINQRILRVKNTSGRLIKEHGVTEFLKISSKHLYRKMVPRPVVNKKIALDILIINGTTLPHPERYRVDHQLEQLAANGVTADKVYYEDLTLDMLRLYRGFIFFRCPVTPTIQAFIELAKKRNKTCFFDIDDLMIDTAYTDQIEYVGQMDPQTKAQYDDGVKRTKQTLALCEYGITTTERLQSELRDYGLKDVFINRNVASNEMVLRSNQALNTVEKDNTKFILGYFSGSITHNEDFNMILPSVISFMEKHQNVYLKVVGILDIPEQLEAFSDRILRIPFMNWQEMPKEIATCDINLAPLTNTIFNEAKSENKWIEAALVKVPTLASDFGAFRSQVIHQETGFLVADEEWLTGLETLYSNETLREEIAQNAYDLVLAKHTTIASGNELATYLMNRLRPNVAFVLPSTDISGGVNVVLKHADILQKNGYDVTLINMVSPDHFPYSRNVSDHYSVLVKFQDDILMFFDNIVATLWSTLPDFIDSYPNKKRTTYFVQNFETGFIEYGDVRKLIANATYASLKNIHYTTMSLWCQEWLENEFHKQAQYASNGIDLEFFPYHKRDTTNRKIKIIIEGDSQDHYKNVDEAFRVVELLSPDKYEISYLSYRSKPKEWYRVDHFYNKIAPEKVGEVYAEHDILIKSSLLESFSYPPLEMMATGGVSVVVPNGGNAEYLKDGENCLLYPAGQLEVAVELIEKLTSDAEFFDEISMNGRKTAESYHWNNMEKAILGLYPVDTEKKQRFLIATDVANDLEPIVYPVNQLNQQDIYKKYYLKTALESQLPQKVSEEKQFFDILIQVDERMHQFEWTVFEQMIASINAQQYAHYRVHLNCDLEFIEKVKENLIVQKDSRFVIYEQVALSQLEIKEDSYIILYQVGDSVLPTFLSSYANKIAQEPQVVALYTDEDKLLGNETFNHFDPYFKSDMNEILLYSINYMSHTLSIRSAELQQFLVSHAIIKLTEQKKWELAFWIHERFSKNQVAHIESVQYSHRVRDVINDQTILKEEGPIDLTIAKHVSQYMPTQHQTVTCQARTFAPNTYEIKLETTDSEKVSIIIPTKNQFELLRQCVYSILTHTTHKDYEIILVDTGSKDPNVLDFYEAIQTDDSRVRVVEFVQKTFNFSAACNKGAACATGEHFVFLNNDTAILDASWLEKLLVYSVRKDTGCIGTKLVYPGNRMIQHAGIATGVNGVATNLFNGLYIDQIQSRSQHYYYNFTREVTAVTAACLMIKRTIFEAVSGFDVAFAVTFNDVDFCLRVQELELKNVYVADSLLEHRESVSVGKLHEEHREQAEFLTSETLFKSRWSNFVVHDPYFNRNFSTQTSMMELPNSY